MKYSIIATGSKGNCYLIESKNTKILIDIGVSYKRIHEALEKMDMDFSMIDAVLLTHSHTDHVNALRMISKHNPTIPILASAATKDEILKKRPFKTLSMDVFAPKDLDVEYLSIGEFAIMPKELDHDVKTLGFVIIEGEQTIIHATDTKNFNAFEGVSEVDFVAAECNYVFDNLMDDISNKTTDTKSPANLEYLYRKFDTHASFETYEDFINRLKVHNDNLQDVPLHISDAHATFLYNKMDEQLKERPITFIIE